MFLVKRDQVVFPIAYDEGCVIELDFLRGINDSDTPTLEMFACLTVNQMLAMMKRMHTKITNGKANGRDSLTEYIRDHWNTFRQRLLENGIQTEYHVGKQDIVFLKKNDREYFPLTISSGFIVDFQNDLENLQRVPFTENMARTMSVAGMERVIEWLDIDPPRRKMSKNDLASYLVLNFDAFLDNLGDDASDEEETEDAENSEDEVVSEKEDTKGDTLADTCIEKLPVVMEELNQMKGGEKHLLVEMELPSMVQQFKFYYKDGIIWQDLTKSLTKQGIEMDKFRVMCGMSEPPHYETIMSTGIPSGFVVKLEPAMKGGGKLVKKSQLKVSSHVKVPLDQQSFQRLYATMERVKADTSISLKTFLNSVKLEDLKTYEDYLAHGKAPNAKKVQALSQLNDEVALVGDFITELTALKAKMEEMVVNSATTSCSSTDGDFKMSEFRKCVEVAIGVKEAIAQSSAPVVSQDATMNAI